MNDDIVQVGREGAVAIVTLNYPQRRNAFSLAMRRALRETLYSLNHLDAECRALVLTGAGGVFCAGGDISEMKERRTLEFRERNLLPLEVFRLLATGPRPVVAAVEGFAMGAGVCSRPRAITWSSRARRGSAVRSSRSACCPIAACTGRSRSAWAPAAPRADAERARVRRRGSVRERFRQPHRRCRTGARCRARGGTQYAALPPLALAHLKAALATGCDTLDKAIETEVNLQPLLRRSEDHREAAAAFMAKRTPVFVGN